MSDMNDIHMNNFQAKGVIQILSIVGSDVFHITETMIQLLQMKGNFGALTHEDTIEHLTNFMEACGTFVFKNISQECVRLRSFPLFLTGEATRWLPEFQNDPVSALEELNDDFF